VAGSLGAKLPAYPPFLADYWTNVVPVTEVGSIAAALLSLLSSIVGGVLVLTGQYFARRADDRRQWLLRLHEAAADLATSYLQEAALVNDSRRSGKPKKDVATTTYVVDRQKALGRFRALPWGPIFETERRSMGSAIEELWRTWDDTDVEFQRAYDDARAAVATFTTSIGQHLLDPKRRRRSSHSPESLAIRS
jgi:hypothetical protein